MKGGQGNGCVFFYQKGNTFKYASAEFDQTHFDHPLLKSEATFDAES